MTSIETHLTDHIDLWTSAITRKSSTGRGRSEQFSLHGIKKLRALILDLAVRGKLVPQDPHDEPASELLKRITSERRQLILDGKAKRGKPMKAPEVVPFPIPATWVWSQLGAVTNYGATEKQDPLEVDPQTWVLELEDVEKGTSRLIKRVRYSDRPFQSQKNRFHPGDVIYGKLRPYLDKVLIADEVGVCTTEMVPIRAYTGIEPAYLKLFLKSPFFIALANASTHGMNLPRLGTDRARETSFAIPPIAEQHRIVAKVDELMALCYRLEAGTYEAIDAHQLLVTELLATLTASRDAGELAENWARIETHFDTLFVTEESVNQLKQTILHLAVMGRLVPQDPKDEPFGGSGFASAGRLPNDSKGKEARETLDLPVGWHWCEFGKMGEIIGGGTPSKSVSEYWEGHIPWVSPKDMKVDYIHDAVDKISELAVQNSAAKIVPPNYLLIVVRGMILAHSFPVAITTTSVTINQDMKAVEIGDLNPRYILLLMKAMRPVFLEIVDRSSHGTCKLVSSKLWSTKLPIPPANEQKRIVAKVEQLIDLCDALKENVARSRKYGILYADTVVANASK